MGCDIHWRVERRKELKQKEYGPWEIVDVPWFDAYRSYNTFTALASVRDFYGFEGPRFSEPRGLPEDLAKHPEGKLDKWGDPFDLDFEFGDHSQSWVKYRELAKFWSANKEALIDTWIHPLVHMMGGLDYEMGQSYEVRFVFGFDS